MPSRRPETRTAHMPDVLRRVHGAGFASSHSLIVAATEGFPTRRAAGGQGVRWSGGQKEQPGIGGVLPEQLPIELPTTALKDRVTVPPLL